MRDNFMYRKFYSKVAVLQEGREPLPRCKMCRMHILVMRLLDHQRTACCFKNDKMRLRRRDVEVTNKCLEMEFSLTSKEREETIMGVALFKYLVWPLEQ